VSKQNRKLSSELGNYIRYARQTRGLTLKGLSEKSNISTGYLSKLENSRRFPSNDVLKHLANALEVSVMNLLQISMEASSFKDRDLSEVLMDGNYTVKGEEVPPEVRILLVEIIQYITNNRWRREDVSNMFTEDFINKIKVMNNLL
jgi:transcriptional regulator with XRE-family HTH domain